MPHALTAAAILSLVLHGWGYGVGPACCVVLVVAGWMVVDALRGLWRWATRPTTFGPASQNQAARPSACPGTRHKRRQAR